jgi:hypothetical protein
MSDIYKLHGAAFANVSAFVILKGGERVATIAFKFPRDGAGRLYAYVHWIGVEMARGHADGYGYDKKSAAVESAIVKVHFPIDLGANGSGAFEKALLGIDGSTWDTALREAGFTVLQAV